MVLSAPKYHGPIKLRNGVHGSGGGGTRKYLATYFLAGNPLRSDATIIGCDSDSAIKLTADPVYHERTKHIDVRVHFIRDHVQRDVAVLLFVPTAKQVADSLTKPVPRAKVRFCRDRMGLTMLENTL